VRLTEEVEHWNAAKAVALLAQEVPIAQDYLH